MIRPGQDDLLTQLTAEALAGVMAEAQTSGRILPCIIYNMGSRKMFSLPARFADFLAVAVSVHRCFDAQQALLAKVGFPFFTVASSFAAMNAGQPHLLTPEAVNWDSTRYDLLRSAGARFVVVVDHVDAAASDLSGLFGAPALVAIGLHPAGMAGATATSRPRHPRGFEFDPIRTMRPGAVQARALETYMQLFAPEVN